MTNNNLDNKLKWKMMKIYQKWPNKLRKTKIIKKHKIVKLILMKLTVNKKIMSKKLVVYKVKYKN